MRCVLKKKSLPLKNKNEKEKIEKKIYGLLFLGTHHKTFKIVANAAKVKEQGRKQD